MQSDKLKFLIKKQIAEFEDRANKLIEEKQETQARLISINAKIDALRDEKERIIADRQKLES